MSEPVLIGLHDFDFLAGSWLIHNRRLRAPLSGGDDWYEFEATSWCRPMLGGAGNVDEYRAPSLGLIGMTVRTLDTSSGEWSIYWASSTLPGPLQEPVVGRFSDGVGEFCCDDDFAGKPIRVRYLWSDMSDTGAQWEQAFSADGGASWETNWVMRLERSEEEFSGS
ncbi:MAG: hypothetical protein ABI912_11730 [Actinomycetota bacterium]